MDGPFAAAKVEDAKTSDAVTESESDWEPSVPASVRSAPPTPDDPGVTVKSAPPDSTIEVVPFALSVTVDDSTSATIWAAMVCDMLTG